MSSCSESIERTLQKVLRYSGRFIMRIGQYSQCINDDEMKYRWVTLSNQLQKQQQVNIGLCLPHQCSNLQIIKIINDTLENAQNPFRVKDINSEVEQYEVAYTWVFYFIIVIMAALTLLTLASTILYNSRMKYSKTIKLFALQQSTQIFTYKQNRLNVFNGIKTYAMLWIVMGHQYFFHLNIASNVLTFYDTLQSPFFLIVESGMLAVDVFLFVGGFFVAYTILRSKAFTIKGIPIAVLKRMARFWPSYLTAVMIFSSVFMHLGSGPFWSANQSQTGMCGHWWRSLLFIDNLVDYGRTICMSWSWYLQIDMQLFLSSLFILAVYRKHKLVCVSITLTLIIISLVLTFFINFTHGFKQAIHLQDFGPQDTSFIDVYTKPWCRCSPYFYGLLFSMLYIQFENQTQIKQNGHYQRMYRKLKQSKLLQLITQTVGVLIMAFIIFIPRTSQIGYRWNTLINAIYLTFSKPLYVLGLSLVIAPTLLGFKNSYVKIILDNKFTNSISKITFMMYLIHLMIIMQYIYSSKVEVYYSIIPLFGLFIAHSAISAIVALFLVCTIEIPFYKLQKIVQQHFSSKTQKDRNQKL